MKKKATMCTCDLVMKKEATKKSDDLTLFLQLMKATLAVFADVYS